jgi:hypothetical protein
LFNCHVAALLLQVGAVLSQGQQNKRRLMYVWSADGSVQPGNAAWAKKQQQRRQASRTAHTSTTAPFENQQEQQQPVTPAAADPQQQQQQVLQAERSSSSSSTPKKQGGLFGNLFNALLSGLSDDDQQQQHQQRQQRDTSSSQQAAEQSSSAASDSSASSQQQSEAEQAGEGEEEEQGDDSGVFMYGAAVLSMKGPIALEPVTCQVRLAAGAQGLSGWGCLMELCKYATACCVAAIVCTGRALRAPPLQDPVLYHASIAAEWGPGPVTFTSASPVCWRCAAGLPHCV